jgi:hypothetical protein
LRSRPDRGRLRSQLLQPFSHPWLLGDQVLKPELVVEERPER